MKMSIKFFTKNLNETLYKRLILMYIYDMLDRGSEFNYVYFMRHWEFKIYPSTDSPNDPFFDGREGVGGVTGMRSVKLYLEDKRTNIIRDFFRRVLRQNFIVITHEISHALLIEDGRNEKVALRNDDWSGHKAGTMLNFSTAEVHDRHVEGRFKTMNVWVRAGFTWAYMRGLKVIDIDDLV